MIEKCRIQIRIKMSGKNNDPLGVQWRVESSHVDWSQFQGGRNKYLLSAYFVSSILICFPNNTGVSTIPKLLIRKQVWGREVTHLILQRWDLNSSTPNSKSRDFCTTPPPFQQSWGDLRGTFGGTGVQVQALRKLRFGWTKGWRKVILG